MRTARFAYALPPDRIAQAPAAERTGSRLLYAAADAFQEMRFREIGTLLRRGDVLVANDTRVLPARLAARKPSGGRVEILLERVVDAHTARAQLRANKPIRDGQKILVADAELTIVTRQSDQNKFCTLRCDAHRIADIFQRYGHTPLPPYIARAASADDAARYQTVYARADGAVAAPTAGLHFNPALIAQLQQAGVDWVTLTLHIGAGTFQPVRTENAAAHTMHREWFQLDADACARIQQAKARGGRVIAVGTTVVRALESAAASGRLQPSSGDTELFILPGYQFRAVDALLTNFHLPRSTLLMLVCAFGGYAKTMRAYRYAIAHKFRFYSYGDAMFIARA